MLEIKMEGKELLLAISHLGIARSMAKRIYDAAGNDNVKGAANKMAINAAYLQDIAKAINARRNKATEEQKAAAKLEEATKKQETTPDGFDQYEKYGNSYKNRFESRAKDQPANLSIFADKKKALLNGKAISFLNGADSVYLYWDGTHRRIGIGGEGEGKGLKLISVSGNKSSHTFSVYGFLQYYGLEELAGNKYPLKWDNLHKMLIANV